ncbi:MAG: hypothetical protein R2690_00095 [Acidimicrobiales bacterium]
MGLEDQAVEADRRTDQIAAQAQGHRRQPAMDDRMSRRDDPPPRGFNLRTIGPEPKGATPLEEEDLVDLIPAFVATRGDLNIVEFDNIIKAMPWALDQARRG